MTSFTSPISIYNMCGRNVERVQSYRKEGAMNYIYRSSPIFALILQKARMDSWFDAPDFNCTCFIPSYEYSTEHLQYFIDNLDRKTAYDIVKASVILGRMTTDHLSKQEYIPTIGKSYVNVNGNLLNEKYVLLKRDILVDNGVIHVINGLIPPECLG